MQQNQIGFKLAHPAQALIMSLKVSDVEARDILKAVEASSTSGDHEVPLLAPVRRALDVTKALLPWMEAIEWEAAGCGDSDCDEDGDESDEENIMERGEQEESELDGAGSVESVNSSGAEAGEEDFISDNEAATALVRLLSPISPTDGEPVNIDNFEQAPLSGFRFVDKLFPAVDGAGMYPLICRMNHSCEPNVSVTCWRWENAYSTTASIEPAAGVLGMLIVGR